MAKVDEYLNKIIDGGGSDLHLSPDHPAYWRQSGLIQPFDPNAPKLTSEEIFEMLREIMPEQNTKQLKEEFDTDCAYAIPGKARFRVNGFKDMHGFGAVFRQIPEKIPTFEDLGLPEAVRELCMLSKGLVVVTGPTGSGKSTTLSAMIDYINRNRTEHIISIEDPIEFVHNSAKCLINQREVHRDTETFARALRAALREDPDIVLIGEIRDLETMEIAIETAETGHLVFATLHTNTAIATVDRIIDRFPGERQNQIRSMLSDTLKGVVAQILCPRIGGGRIAAFEILLVNTPVAAMIRESKTHMLTSTMQTSRNIGMQTFTDELFNMIIKGHVTPMDAYIKAVDKEELENKLKEAGVSLDFKSDAAEAAHQKRLEKMATKINGLGDKLDAEPGNAKLMAQIAWHFATTEFDEIRNGKQALEFAEKAYKITRDSDADVLESLGVAHAELRNFKKAMSYTRQALELREKAGDTSRSIGLQLRLRQFENQEPHREEG